MSDINDMIRTAEENPPAEGAPLVPADWYDDEDPDVRLGWKVEDRGSADWCLKRLAECRAEADAIEAQKAAAIARIEKRAAELVAKTSRGVAFFEARLSEWANRERSTLLRGKSKSADFLHGRISWKSKPGRLVVVDKGLLVTWLERQPPEAGLFRLVVEPDMTALQAKFKEDGTTPPGMRFNPGEETLTVKPVLPEGPALKGKE